MNNILNKADEYIKYFDLFGYRLDFNFHKKGSEYKTSAGGIVSIAIRILIIFVFVTRL